MQQVSLSVDLRALDACCGFIGFACGFQRTHTLCLQDLHYFIVIKIYLMFAELIKQPFRLCAFASIWAENLKSF